MVLSFEDAKNVLCEKARLLISEKETVFISIDGRCASGKTGLSSMVVEQLQTDGIPSVCLHMDDFFLTPEMRTAQRLSQPGGNVDYERFLSEVLIPASEGKEFEYRPYRCHGEIPSPTVMYPNGVLLIEGVYSQRKELRPFYDFTVFIDVPSELQLERIEKRGGGEAVVSFRERWIPLEEAYFSAVRPQDRADMVLQLK